MKLIRFINFSTFCCLFFFACEKTELPVEEPEPTQPKPFGEFIDDWTFQVYPKNNYDVAEFKLWVPDSLEDFNAILVLSNYHNGSGFGLVLSEEWQDFAREEKLALIGVHFKSLPTNSGYYSDASGGSGQALIKSIDSLAERNHLLSLKQLPFLMRGYSAGGVFSHNFSEFMPDRVIAFANIRGGSLSETSAVNNQIPGLMLAGENDAASRNDRIKEAVLQKRSEGGLWCFALEPNEDHFGGLVKSDKLIRAFFSKALAKRKIEGSNQLKVISEDTGWLGNMETNELFPFYDYLNDKKEASWLIDEEFATLWQSYQEE